MLGVAPPSYGETAGVTPVVYTSDSIESEAFFTVTLVHTFGSLAVTPDWAAYEIVVHFESDKTDHPQYSTFHAFEAEPSGWKS